jgi:sulfoacetaldehyde acetyltransferase
VAVGIAADAKAATEAMLAVLGQTSRPQPVAATLTAVADARQKWQQELEALAMVPGSPINPRRALFEISRVLPKSAIVTTDIGNVASTANSYLTFTESRKFLAALTFGNCGFAYPAALGAKWARPDCPTFAIVGDGAWGMSLHEVSTAVEQDLPVVALVFNNHEWGAEKKNQIDFYHDRFVGTNIQGPEFAEVAKAMGASGIQVTQADAVGDAVKSAMANGRPTVVEILVDGTQLAPPFRRDALKPPRRLLPKYAHLDDRYGR